MKKSEILVQARGMLVRKTRLNVCYALSGVALLTPGALTQCLELRKWIKDMLGLANDYRQWLWFHHEEFCRGLDITNARSTEDVDMVILPGRLAWMDWMISYWQEEEAKADAQHRQHGFAMAG